jgi:integrase
MAAVVSKASNSMPSCLRVRSLPIEQWSPADAVAWALASQPSQRLIRGGSGAHMKPITLSDLARRYGYFLDFLARIAGLDGNAKATGQVTPGNVARYIEELCARVSSVTAYGSIYKLRRASQLLDPSGDFGWLIELEKDLALVMQPRSKAGRFLLSEVLVECGLILMTEADDSATLSRLAKARQFRNGLMVAMLALHPIRLKNFASLTIGHDFVEIDDQWWIVLSSTATKEARPDERRIDETIAPALGKYLSKHRPVLARERVESRALWISSINGQPMTYHAVAGAIEGTTRSTIGVGISPHMFRTSAASSAAVYAGHNPHLASALLHHRDNRVTEKRYNRASSLSAANAFGKLIKKIMA